MPSGGTRGVALNQRLRSVGLLAILAVLVLTPSTVLAALAHPGVVSANPANSTPNVEDDAANPDAAVYGLARKGDTIYVGGEFRTITNSTRTQTRTRHNIMAIDETSGALRSFAPVFDGPVWAIQPYKSALYVGGNFKTVNGTSRRSLVKINASTGVVNNNFKPGIPWGDVTQLAIVRGKLMAGGSYPGHLQAFNLKTGNQTAYVQAEISGQTAPNSGPTKVSRFAVNPAQTRLVGVGTFTSVGGRSREQAFMLRMGRNQAVVNDWYYDPLSEPCAASTIPTYLRDVDFSPDGSYFVFAASGYVPRSGGVGRDVCDAAARFETSELNPYRPTWINYTGGDTLLSVAVTGGAVYVQGHQRWLDNPFGTNSAGPGAVPREGIGALNPSTGAALSWNPGKSRDVGGREFLATSAGLWVGSDGRLFAGEYRAGLAFLPLN